VFFDDAYWFFVIMLWRVLLLYLIPLDGPGLLHGLSKRMFVFIRRPRTKSVSRIGLFSLRRKTALKLTASLDIRTLQIVIITVYISVVL
jgi:hypothetical protein